MRKIIQEYKSVLLREKFHLNEQIVDDLIDKIFEVGIKVDANEIYQNMIDLDDKVFFEVVMTERKEKDSYLITGNLKHFPQEVFIVTPREMLDIIIKENIN